MSRLDRIALADYALPDAEVATLLSPTLLIYLDHVRHNLTRMRDYLGGDLDRWRPHLKTAKVPAVFAEYVRFGLRAFKCATTREAATMLAVLAAAGVTDADLLVAYPHVGPALTALGQLARRHPRTRLSVLCEDPQLLAQVPDALGVFVDLNPGMNRTGIPIAELDRVLAIARAAGARFRGLHSYEGHVHDGDQAARAAQANATYDLLLAAHAWLGAAGVRVGELVTSGTPNFMAALRHAPFRALPGTRHRVSPGTVIYHDARYGEVVDEIELRPAALVLARVVSHPAPGLATCDAGSKSLAAEAGDPCAVVLGHPDWVAQRPSEEHLPLRVPAGALPARGTALYLVPQHVCPTVNLAEQAVLVQAGRVVDVVAVSARAHDVRAAAT